MKVAWRGYWWGEKKVAKKEQLKEMWMADLSERKTGTHWVGQLVQMLAAHLAEMMAEKTVEEMVWKWAVKMVEVMELTMVDKLVLKMVDKTVEKKENRRDMNSVG